MPRGSAPDLTVCQMIGSMKSPQMPVVKTYAIHIAPRKEVAKLLTEPQVKSTNQSNDTPAMLGEF